MCSDIAPVGNTLEETNAKLDEMVDLAAQLMQQTGIKLLWNTCNLFSNPRYACTCLSVHMHLINQVFSLLLV